VAADGSTAVSVSVDFADYNIVNCMQQSPALEANVLSCRQEITHIS
jgi:hypothetical protein